MRTHNICLHEEIRKKNKKKKNASNEYPQHTPRKIF